MTLRSLLTKNKALVAKFLHEQYAPFFTKFNALLVSDNYVTQRQSLKLLGEILLDRANFNIMMRYIGDKRNLQLVMNLLRERSQVRVCTAAWMGFLQFRGIHPFFIF